jgi:tRNA (adenine37-N6)-methyltransferase
MIEPITYVPIGVIRSSFVTTYDAPRQPGADGNGASAVIELFPHTHIQQALIDLQGFSHIWVVVHLHKVHHWKPKVLPPRETQKRGVFATRSPHRPNAIGLSCVPLLYIRGRRIGLGQHDFLSGTPVLDIKPYIPQYDSIPDAQQGWVQSIESNKYHVYGYEALPEDVMVYVLRTLRQSPFPHPYKRIKFVDGNEYELRYKTLRIRFTVDGLVVNIVSCSQDRDNA